MAPLTVNIMGGLGNQLFQLAALLHIARKTQRTPYIQSLANPSTHSSVPYFDTIFELFRNLHSTVKPTIRITEPSLAYANWAPLLRMALNPEISGYFQDWRYVDPDFVPRLRFSGNVLYRYPTVNSSVFLHIRGGDYVGNPGHDIGLDGYYQRAIAHFPDAHFLLVTNDLEYAMSRPCLVGLKYTLVMESELDTLYVMSQCSGGICANSSFSWWGAYLNPHRKIVMPDRWYRDPSYATEGYYFPGVIKCQV